MTYLKFENMRDYTQKELRNKCSSSPWLVCVFALIFVILTSLLIYVAWTPRTTVENIEIQIADYPEFSNLNQDQGQDQDPKNYVDLDPASSENGVNSPKNTTVLGTTQEKNGMENFQVGNNPTPTEEKNPDDELLILIFEDPENDSEDSESSSRENSADENVDLGKIQNFDLETLMNPNFDFQNNETPDFEDLFKEMSKFGEQFGNQKLGSDAPWSIIKKTWYLETKIQNNPDNYFGQTDKKVPNMGDWKLDSQMTTDEDLIDSEEQDLPLNDLKIPSQNHSSSPSGSNLSDDLKDLDENAPNLLRNPFLTKFFRDQFPKQFSNDQKTNDQSDQNGQNAANLFQNPFLSKILTDLFPISDQKDQTLRYEVGSDDVDDQNLDFDGPFLHIFRLLDPKNDNSNEDLTPVKNNQDGRTKTAEHSYPEETDEDVTKEILMSTDDLMSKFGLIPKDDMSSDKMSSDKMSSDKMSSDKMSSDKMSSDKMSSDKMSSDKMSSDKMSSDKMSSDKMSSDKMSDFDVMSQNVKLSRDVVDKPSDKIVKSVKNDDPDDLILSNPGSRSGVNKITESDENFNTFREGKKDFTTLKSPKSEGLKARNDQDVADVILPEDPYDDSSMDKKVGDKSQKIPVMDVEEN